MGSAEVSEIVNIFKFIKKKMPHLQHSAAYTLNTKIFSDLV